MDKYENMYKSVMTAEIANFIKLARKNASWRRVATIVSGKYPELDIIPSNQLEGMELCSAARDFLKDTDWD